jgi:hypothetical protein
MVTQRGRSAVPSDSATPQPRSGVSGISVRGLPLQWRWLLPVAVAAATAAWLAAVASGHVTGAAQILLMTCGAVFTGVAAGVPLWQQGRAAWALADAVAAAQGARAAMRVAMEDALDPFCALLLQLASAKPRHKPLLRGEAIQLAVATIAQVSELGQIGEPGAPGRLRASYFALDPGPPRRLVLRAYAGRSGTPTAAFDETTRAGQFLLRIADDRWTTIDDTKQLRVPTWLDNEHHYRTFAAGPVPGTGQEPAGLVVVDALAPGELGTLDLPLVRLLIHMLSLALQV